MNALALAALYRAAFPTARPWSASEFSDLLAQPGAIAELLPAGFALGRVAAGEAELISLAVHPDVRRQGLGRTLLRGFETRAAARAASRAFLEVAADNTAALSLYQAAGWRLCGRRQGYYARPGLPAMDALVLEKHLTDAALP